MARIRSIKPEFWSSEQVVECSTSARLLFVGLWNFCDDGGVIPAKPIQLKMKIFPGDPFTKEDVWSWIEELIESGLLGLFENKNEQYLYVTGWSSHQRVDKPTLKFPGPFEEGSSTIRRGLDEGSQSALGGLTPGREWKGGEYEGRGSEGSGEEDSPIGESSPTEPVVKIPLIDKTDYDITAEQIADWQKDFPAIDVEQEIRNCRQWNNANPKNRKTRAGILRHITAWLTRAQDRAPTKRASEQTGDAREQARERLFGESTIEGEARRVN